MLTFFLCFRSKLATKVHVVLRRTVRLDIKIRSQNVHFHHSFRGEQNFATTKFLIINSHRVSRRAVRISSRAVRVSSRAVRVFPALSLRRLRPSYGTFFLMVFQGNSAGGRTGHMINICYWPAHGRSV